MTICNEVTVRQRVEEELRESERKKQQFWKLCQWGVCYDAMANPT